MSGSVGGKKSQLESSLQAPNFNRRLNLFDQTLKHFAGTTFHEGLPTILHHVLNRLCPAHRGSKLGDEVFLDLVNIRGR